MTLTGGADAAVWRLTAFRVVVTADLVSILGTQLARFALAFLVFDRTDSAVASALAYALTFLPSAVGGFVLGRLGDRFPERTVMITADVVRAVLFAVMSLPGMPVPVILVLLVLAVFLDPAFDSAVLAYLRRVLTAEQLRTSSALRTTVDQVAQVVGFGIGGAVVLAVGASGALLIDAATFAFSAVVVGLLLSRRRRDDGAAAEVSVIDVADVASAEPLVEAATGVLDRSAHDGGTPAFRGLWRDGRTRAQMCFAVLIGVYVLPEALAVAYGAQIGASAVQSSVLLAMGPFGSAVGYSAIVRVPPGRRPRVATALALACGLPLLVCATGPGIVISCASWFLSGLLSAYQVEVLMALVRAVPADATSRHLGQLSAWLMISQGLCFAAAGALTTWWSPGAVVAGAGAVGVVAVAVLAGWERLRTAPVHGDRTASATAVPHG